MPRGELSDISLRDNPTMKLRLSLFSFLFAYCVAAFGAEPVSFADWQTKLKTAATHARFSAAVLGVKVESLDTGKVLFEQNADKLMKPASNGKMYTGALALDRLEPEFKIR